MSSDIWDNLVEENERADISLLDANAVDICNTFIGTNAEFVSIQPSNDHTFILDFIEYPNGICLLLLCKDKLSMLQNVAKNRSISMERVDDKVSWYKEGTKVANIICIENQSSVLEQSLVVPFSCSLLEWNKSYLEQVLPSEENHSDVHRKLKCGDSMPLLHDQIKLERAYLMIVSRSKGKRAHWKSVIGKRDDA